MAKAKRVHSTPPTNSSASLPDDLRRDRAREERAEAYFNMEEDVYDLESMGEITEQLVADWVDDVTNMRSMSRASFATRQLADMLHSFRANYQTNAWAKKELP